AVIVQVAVGVSKTWMKPACPSKLAELAKPIPDWKIASLRRKVADVRVLPPASMTFQWFSKVDEAMGPAHAGACRHKSARAMSPGRIPAGFRPSGRMFFL